MLPSWLVSYQEQLCQQCPGVFFCRFLSLYDYIFIWLLIYLLTERTLWHSGTGWKFHTWNFLKAKSTACAGNYELLCWRSRARHITAVQNRSNCTFPACVKYTGGTNQVVCLQSGFFQIFLLLYLRWKLSQVGLGISTISKDFIIISNTLQKSINIDDPLPSHCIGLFQKAYS